MKTLVLTVMLVLGARLAYADDWPEPPRQCLVMLTLEDGKLLSVYTESCFIRSMDEGARTWMIMTPPVKPWCPYGPDAVCLPALPKDRRP